MSQVHADLVMLLVGLALALAVCVAAAGASIAVMTATRVLVAVLGPQAAIGSHSTSPACHRPGRTARHRGGPTRRGGHADVLRSDDRPA